ncbi:MAG: arylsulfatase [Akkermansiaceae bacterium]
MKIPFVLSILTSLLSAAEKPNIVLIMVDDMGYSDLGCWGGEVDTPNIDLLAKNGLRFTQFYNSARCCPTRATLLTGLHPHETGIGLMASEEASVTKDIPPAYAGNLNDSCVTLAQVAKSAGYATFMTGKWHVAGQDQEDWPMQRGFDRFYGTIAGAAHFFHPEGWRSIYDGNEKIAEPESTTDRDFYTTDAFTDHAIDYIAENEKGGDKPFFLYLAYNAPHWPLHVADQELDKYRGKYDIGWDKLREQRFKAQVESGLIPASWKMSPRDPDVPAWDSLTEKEKEESALRMSAYAGMIDRVDQKIGDLMAELKKNGEFDNTLIMFLSDNGACAEGGMLGGGDPVAGRAKGKGSFHPALGKAWANASATPYRLYKHYAHEGGANTPFIAHWPARIKADRDWFRQPAHIIDVMATVAEITEVGYPEKFNNNPILPIDGVSLTSAFDSKPLVRKTPLIIEHQNNSFVRDGEWKLVGRNVAPASGLKPERWELYHISFDGTELNDLAKEQPERVEAMSGEWKRWADRVGIFPKPPARKKRR